MGCCQCWKAGCTAAIQLTSRTKGVSAHWEKAQYDYQSRRGGFKGPSTDLQVHEPKKFNF